MKLPREKDRSYTFTSKSHLVTIMIKVPYREIGIWSN